MFTNISFQNVGPGYGQRMAQQLETDVKNGALGLGEIMKNLRTPLHQDRRHTAAHRRSGARSDLGDGGAAEHPGPDSHGRSTGILPADQLYKRAMAGAGALRGSPVSAAASSPRSETINAERGQPLPQAPEAPKFIMAHLGWHANNLARVAKMSRRDAKPVWRSRCGPVDPIWAASAARGSRFPREIPGSGPVPERIAISPTNSRITGGCSRRGRRVLRLLPRLPCVLEALWSPELPDPVLRKLYYQNALKLIPGMPRTGFRTRSRRNESTGKSFAELTH